MRSKKTFGVVRGDRRRARIAPPMSKAALDAREPSDAAAEAGRVAGRLRELERKMRRRAPERVRAEPRPRARSDEPRPEVAKGVRRGCRAPGSKPCCARPT